MADRKRTVARDPDQISPLKQARLDRAATLETVCAELDQQTPDGRSGVTPSMLSNWERGVHDTSSKYRRLLAAYYKQPVKDLFADQDRRATAPGDVLQVLVDHRDMSAAMIDVVRSAHRHLVVLGSRSRHAEYLTAIEEVLAQRPELVHIRVLFGPPRHQVLKEHLMRLLQLRDPHDRSLGLKTLHIGIVDDDPGTPERFFCASETTAVVPIPSLTSAEAFDSGVVFGSFIAGRYIDHARQAYAGSRRVETRPEVAALPTVRSWEPDTQSAAN